MITRGEVEVNVQEKWETNSEPLSEVMWEGTLCLEKTWRRKSLVNSGEVIMSSVGMKIHCLERQSTTTRIVVCLEEAGSCLIKSMEMEFHGFEGMGSCFRSPYSLCLETFACAQVVHKEMYSLMKVCTLGQVYLQHTSSKVWFCLKCLERG